MLVQFPGVLGAGAPTLRGTIVGTRPANLLSLYWFDVASGNVPDSAGTGPPLVRTAGGAWTYNEPGADRSGPAVTRSVRYDGTAHHVDHRFISAGSTYWNPIQTSDFTAMCLFRLSWTSPSVFQVFSFFPSCAAATAGFAVQATSAAHAPFNEQRLVFHSGGVTAMNTIGPTLALNAWHLVTLIRTGATARAYLGVTEFGNVSGVLNGNSANLLVSAFADMWPVNRPPMNGWFQGIAIWNAAISVGELAAIHARVSTT